MRILGLISGTSHDGIDAALVDIDRLEDELQVRVVAHASTPYAPALRRDLIAALPPAQVDLAQVCRLDTHVGQAFAAAASELLGAGHADLIVSHGQTVYHWVQDHTAWGTLQLGQPAWISARCGVPVLSDLRAADIAAGGHGAPLASTLDVLLLGGRPQTVAALNLGGIANATLVRPDRPPLAYDLGPANALIDAAVLRMTSGVQAYDHGGEHAARGKVIPSLLDDLLTEPYYALPAPKSTGKELFHAGYLDAALHRAGLPGVDPDVIATLTELSARVTAAELQRHEVTEVVAAGGGVDNPVLMRRLAAHTPGVRWETTDAWRIPPSAKEAVLMAVIGWLSAHGLPGTVPSCTGAREPSVAGTLTLGPRRLTGLDDDILAERAPWPVRLVVQA